MSSLARITETLARLSLADRFRLAGTATLAAGTTAAVWIWATVPEAVKAEVPLARTRVQERQLEIIGGKFAVEAARITEWFDGLWVGRQLGTTLFVLAAATTLLCFWLGRVAALPPLDGDDERIPPRGPSPEA